MNGLVSGRKSALSMADAMNKVNEAMDYEDLGRQTADFKKLQTAWVALGGDVKKQKQFLIDNREELDKTGIAVRDIVDAENLFVNNSEAYLSALSLRAKAAAGVKLASEEYSKAIKLESENEAKLNELREREKFLMSQSMDYYEVSTAGEGSIMKREELIRDVRREIANMTKEVEAYEKAGQA